MRANGGVESKCEALLPSADLQTAPKLPMSCKPVWSTVGVVSIFNAAAREPHPACYSDSQLITYSYPPQSGGY